MPLHLQALTIRQPFCRSKVLTIHLRCQWPGPGISAFSPQITHHQEGRAAIHTGLTHLCCRSSRTTVRATHRRLVSIRRSSLRLTAQGLSVLEASRLSLRRRSRCRVLRSWPGRSSRWVTVLMCRQEHQARQPTCLT